jgi:opacity protein-like surface antigen
MMKSGLILLALSVVAQAGEPVAPAPQIMPASSHGSGWDFTVALYAPLMGLEGDIGVAGLAPARVDISFEDILDNLDGGLSGAFEARKDRWSITADAIWLKISTAANPIANSYLRVSQEQIMASLSVGFEIYGNESTTIDLIGGAALNSLDVDMDLLTPALPVTSRSGSGSQEWIDPFVGLRIRQQLGDRWSIYATGVYGGFEVSSDEYWQVLAGIGYRISENTTLALAYRIISVDYHQGGFVYDTETSGPNLGLIIRF